MGQIAAEPRIARTDAISRMLTHQQHKVLTGRGRQAATCSPGVVPCPIPSPTIPSLHQRPQLSTAQTPCHFPSMMKHWPPRIATAAASSSQQAVAAEDVQAAWSFLKEFSLKMFRGLGSAYTATLPQRTKLKDALLLVYRTPWPAAGWVPPATDDASSSTSQPLVMIGLMAGDVKMGARAMRDYCQALGLTYTKPESRVPNVTNVAAIQGPVYMKYNSVSKLCYVSPYLGKERGVLLQMGVEQLGHFPLGMFDEDMTAPPPPM